MHVHQIAQSQPVEGEDIDAWQARQIRDALAKAKAGGPFIAHDRVAEWALSLGTNSPLPRPVP